MWTTLSRRSPIARMPFYAVGWACTLAAMLQSTATAQTIVKRLEAATDRIEMTVNTSRILTLDERIPRAQVNNPELLTVTPLSPKQIQISATKPGVTQVNLWSETDKVYSVDVVVYGDARELELALKTLYPHSSVRVFRYSNSLVLKGFVDRPDQVSHMVRLAEDYSPKVINNISVGGVQQVLLNVQVMEVSRTKLRKMGFDFAQLNGNDFAVSSISGLISEVATDAGITAVTGTQGDTVTFGIVDGSNSFFGFLEAIRQNNLLKVLAEPKLATVSGRPASFNSGGEFPVLVPQSLGTVSIEYKKFGTQVNFLPLVLGNGNIRLEVRPRVSEIDSTRSVTVNEFTIPGLRVREVDTAVEMKAGQTLALAGLIQTRVEAQNRGLPILADMPLVGAAFRAVEHTSNEVELLILVRPEFVDPLDPHEVPAGGPGMNSCPPTDKQLYWDGHLEVPCCPNCGDSSCSGCGRQASPAYQRQEVIPAPANEPAGQATSSWPRTAQAGAASSLQGSHYFAAQQAAHRSEQKAVQVQGTVRLPSSAAQSDYFGDRSTQANRPAYGNPPGMIGPVGYDLDAN